MRIEQQNSTPIASVRRDGPIVSPVPEGPPSTSVQDVLEVSSLGTFASSLGTDGVAVIRNLIAGGRIPENRLLGFLQNLDPSSLKPDSISSLLGRFSSYAEILTTPELRSVFDEVEARGVSGDLKYLDALDNVFDLGHRNVGEIFSAGKTLSDEEFDVYLKSLADLLKAGVVGTETVKFRGEPTKVFIENEIGSDYARSPLYRDRFPF